MRACACVFVYMLVVDQRLQLWFLRDVEDDSDPALFDDITGIKHLWTSERACEPGPAVSDLTEGPVIGVCVSVFTSLRAP